MVRADPAAGRQAGRACAGGAVNDVLLSAAAGALRSYLQNHGDGVDGLSLRAIVPVNLRTSDVKPDLGKSSASSFWRCRSAWPSRLTDCAHSSKIWMRLGDGFVTDSVPVSAVRAMGADYVIGVDILAPAIRKGWGALGYAIAGVEIMAQKAGRGYYQADCLISPDLAGVSYLFLDFEKLVALGEQAAEERLPAIQTALAAMGTSVPTKQ